MAQAQKIPAQHVQAFDIAAGHRFREYTVLDQFHFIMNRFQHRHVIVDDKIQNCVEDEIFPFCKCIR